jgi:ketosteroid isomerase-like protein
MESSTPSRDTAWAMSQENVEVVRAAVDTWNSGDMAGVRDFYDPDVIMRVAPDWPEPGPFVGRDAVMQQLSEARGAFDNDWAEIGGEPLAAGDRVIVRLNWHGTGRGPQSDMEWTLIYSVRNGRIFGVEYFWDYADALEAAGCRE